MKAFWQSLLLFLSFAFVFVWQNTFFSQYTIQALGFLIFLFILLMARKKKMPTNQGFDANALFESPWSIFILNTVILLFIFSTGGFSSALFFLLYFLAFGVAFVFEPVTVFVYVFSAILIFSTLALKDDPTRNILILASLGLISPLAYFFGKEYRVEEKQEEDLEKLKERSKDAADTIATNVEDLLKKEKQTLKTEDVEKLNEVLEETENLRQETKE